MGKTAQWVPLETADLGALGAIAASLHPDLPERPEVFAEKLKLCPDGCRKLLAGGQTAGYALGHPWTLGAAPALDTFLSALPAAPDCFYIHDVAVLPAARGLGAAGAYTAYAAGLAGARGFRALALVSVYGTAPLWERFGFRAAPGPDLRGYGAGAFYMLRQLDVRGGA